MRIHSDPDPQPWSLLHPSSIPSVQVQHGGIRLYSGGEPVDVSKGERGQGPLQQVFHKQMLFWLPAGTGTCLKKLLKYRIFRQKMLLPKNINSVKYRQVKKVTVEIFGQESIAGGMRFSIGSRAFHSLLFEKKFHSFDYRFPH